MKLYELIENTSLNSSLRLGKASKLIYQAKKLVDRLAKRLLKQARSLNLDSEILSDYDEETRKAVLKIQYGESQIFPRTAIVKVEVYDINDINFKLPPRFAEAINNDEQYFKAKSESAAKNFIKRLHKRVQ